MKYIQQKTGKESPENCLAEAHITPGLFSLGFLPVCKIITYLTTSFSLPKEGPKTPSSISSVLGGQRLQNHISWWCKAASSQNTPTIAFQLADYL